MGYSGCVKTLSPVAAFSLSEVTLRLVMRDEVARGQVLLARLATLVDSRKGRGIRPCL